MASSGTPGPGLSAFVAIGAALVLALATPTGPWQPASVILGWVAVVLVGVSLLTGYTWAMAAGCATFLVRTGIHGQAGAGLADLVLSTVLLLALVELGSASLEGRLIPMHWPAVASRSLLVGMGGGGVVAVVATVMGGVGFGGVGARVAGLAFALLAALLTVGLSRRAGSDP